MYKGESNFPAGTPVSLDWEGYVQRGGGFGIYRNVSYTAGGQEMKGLKTEVLNRNILVAAYKNEIRAYVIENTVASVAGRVVSASLVSCVVGHQAGQ